MAVQRLRLEIDASPAYEFVLSIAAATSAGNPSAPAELVTEVSSIAGGCDYVWAHLLSVAYDTAPPRDVSSLIKQVAGLASSGAQAAPGRLLRSLLPARDAARSHRCGHGWRSCGDP